ncbi:hypothetical protein LWI28_028758 [Acer negundo]|uniref:TF-B3 domain-containing protein n=1 Tax=Acer negundo TaxID=4023 RepID=A0AAD5J4T1_ACENE|nr:hypothetical protein LWI28_008087 [Acer negundo]KAI9187488.1 hypothetical protein LWI28_028758 [Acer negundo]
MPHNFKISKLLSEYDITKKLVLPNRILVHIPIPQGVHFVDLQAMDTMEQIWTLRYYTRPSGNRKGPVFTVGWLGFVQNKSLEVGDKLIFCGHQFRAAGGELQMQYKIQVTRKSNVNYQGEPISLDVENFL